MAKMSKEHGGRPYLMPKGILNIREDGDHLKDEIKYYLTVDDAIQIGCFETREQAVKVHEAITKNIIQIKEED